MLTLQIGVSLLLTSAEKYVVSKNDICFVECKCWMTHVCTSQNNVGRQSFVTSKLCEKSHASFDRDEWDGFHRNCHKPTMAFKFRQNLFQENFLNRSSFRMFTAGRYFACEWHCQSLQKLQESFLRTYLHLKPLQSFTNHSLVYLFSWKTYFLAADDNRMNQQRVNDLSEFKC